MKNSFSAECASKCLLGGDDHDDDGYYARWISHGIWGDLLCHELCAYWGSETTTVTNLLGKAIGRQMKTQNFLGPTNTASMACFQMLSDHAASVAHAEILKV